MFKMEARYRKRIACFKLLPFTIKNVAFYERVICSLLAALQCGQNRAHTDLGSVGKTARAA